MTSVDEAALIAKLRRIEALHAGATTEGERNAATHARERIVERLRQTQRVERPIDFRFSLHDPSERRVFIALARRYGLRPFRRSRQHATTVMLRVTPSFVDRILWPEFQAISAELRVFLDEITTRVIAVAIHGDNSDLDTVANLPDSK